MYISIFPYKPVFIYISLFKHVFIHGSNSYVHIYLHNYSSYISIYRFILCAIYLSN